MLWSDRIKAAKKSGNFTPDDINCAGSWLCCAVGECNTKAGIENKMKINPINLWYSANGTTDIYAVPEEVEEYDSRGMEFFSAVNNDDPYEAERLYKEIKKMAKLVTPMLKRIAS